MKKSIKTYFVGYEQELKQLMEFAQYAFSGKNSVILITGEAGIGKTSLVEEFLCRLREEYSDVVIASGQCSVQSISYLPFQAILRELLENQSNIDIANKHRKRVLDIVIETILEVGPDMIGVFGIPLKALKSFLDKHKLQTTDRLSEHSVPSNLTQVEIFGWYLKVLKDASKQFPLVLFLDDLHWADDSSLQLLLYLGRELEESRILIIGTYRSHELFPGSLLMQIKSNLLRYNAQEISLELSESNPMQVEKTLSFIYDFLMMRYSTAFSGKFVQFMFELTKGNVLFLSELLCDFEEKRLIVSSPNLSKEESQEKSVYWRLEPEVYKTERLPGRIETVIDERIQLLEQNLKEILEYASVQGEIFIVEVIAKILSADIDKLFNILERQLQDTYCFISERGEKLFSNNQSITEYAFRSKLIRTHIYERIPKKKRRIMHQKVAESLECLYGKKIDDILDMLALHFYHAHILPKAVPYCLKASENANIQYGAPEAIKFGHMGLEKLEDFSNSINVKQYAEYKIKFLLEILKAEEMREDVPDKVEYIQKGIVSLENVLALAEHVSEGLRANFYTYLGKLYKRKAAQEGETKEYLKEILHIYGIHHTSSPTKPGEDALKPPQKEITAKVKILFLGANPSETARLRLDEEVRAIRENLKLAKIRDQLKLSQEWAVTINSLMQAMLDESPNIVHFSGHGQEEGIILQDESGMAKLVDEEALASLFNLFRDNITCILLNSCYSELQATAIKRHIQHVIGMKTAIPDKAAIAFTTGFYKAIGAGKDVSFAFDLGIVAIKLQGVLGHNVPILL